MESDEPPMRVFKLEHPDECDYATDEELATDEWQDLKAGDEWPLVCMWCQCRPRITRVRKDSHGKWMRFSDSLSNYKRA